MNGRAQRDFEAFLGKEIGTHLNEERHRSSSPGRRPALAQARQGRRILFFTFFLHISVKAIGAKLEHTNGQE